MQFKVELNNNIDESSLTIEDLTQLIESLKKTYKNVRADMYTYFLSMKHLYRELLFVGILYLFYVLTEDLFYVYFMPVMVLISFIGGIVSAEILTSKTKAKMLEKIEYYTKLRQKLISEAN